MDTCVNGACDKLLISRMLTFVDAWSALGRSTVTQLGMTCHLSSAAQQRPVALWFHHEQLRRKNDSLIRIVVVVQNAGSRLGMNRVSWRELETEVGSFRFR